MAQSLTPTLSTTYLNAGQTSVLTLTLAASGTAPVAGIQWNLNLPAGVTVAWTVGTEATAAGKSLDCAAGAAISTCLVVGLNTTTLGSGIVATGTLSFASTVLGAQTLTITPTAGVNAVGTGVALTGSSVAPKLFAPIIPSSSVTVTII